MLKIVNICTERLTSTYFEHLLIKIIINIESDDQLVLETLRFVRKFRYTISNKNNLALRLLLILQ